MFFFFYLMLFTMIIALTAYIDHEILIGIANVY